MCRRDATRDAVFPITSSPGLRLHIPNALEESEVSNPDKLMPTTNPEYVGSRLAAASALPQPLQLPGRTM
ncbi:hypothetical protein PHMEG_00013935 [Phytophthora megakarya]|uniref:Uncharacterized protein n=1 Tax=Phytophthora megakarya TaxID=4795 RepID=A0A225W767_9STRA|nr:hypothetical protein PHMEG_00013935 [Phytophthora megakarya]